MLDRLARVVGAAALFAACAGPTFIVQQYDGDPRPREAIAILRVNGKDDVRLRLLDDRSVDAPIVEDGRLHIEMLPARHTLVAVRTSGASETSPLLGFVAEAGRVYRVTFVGSEAHVYEVDRAKDTLLRDVTAPPSPEELPRSDR